MSTSKNLASSQKSYSDEGKTTGGNLRQVSIFLLTSAVAGSAYAGYTLMETKTPEFSVVFIVLCVLQAILGIALLNNHPLAKRFLKPFIYVGLIIAVYGLFAVLVTLYSVLASTEAAGLEYAGQLMATVIAMSIVSSANIQAFRVSKSANYFI